MVPLFLTLEFPIPFPFFTRASGQLDSDENSEDMFLPALATIPAAWTLAYIPRFIKLGVIQKRRLSGEINLVLGIGRT